MMNELEAHSRRSVGQLREGPDVRTQLGKCLVVSTDRAKREMISRAADQAGWDTVVCSGERDAMTAAQRIRLQMAWVDLDVRQASSSFHELCRALAVLPKVLLVVCGRGSDTQEEIWARQLGVWLYFPGLSLDHIGEISLLCEQAQLVAGSQETLF